MGDYIRRVGITRVHMEEDAGKLIHTGTTGRISESGGSIVDFNRAGTPLVEIVTEPDIRTPEEAKEYMTVLRNLLLYLDVSNCSMEEGSLRCDANVSIKPEGSDELGTKTEIKNLNSFKFLQKGLEYEIKRQGKILDSGEKVIQETRHFDNNSGTTRALRSKEEAHDYRYFPEPDLVPIIIDKEMIDAIRGTIVELPEEKTRRYIEGYGLSSYDAGFLAGDRKIAGYFERCLECFNDAKAVANWIMGDFTALANKEKVHISESRVSAEDLCKMLKIIAGGKISNKIAKTVFEEMFNNGSDPEEIIRKKGLEQISDSGELESIIDEVISGNPGPVRQYRDGKKKAIGFLIGQVMAKTKGKANPGIVNKIMSKKLG
jgi:aspartyl-tRNA(Asn)/glutamyl-tRNA(Gln) amidotransferase subunit B